MSFILSPDGLKFNDRLIPFTESLSFKIYNRPEKRIQSGKVTSVRVCALSEKSILINAVDEPHSLIVPVRFTVNGDHLNVDVLAGSAVESSGNMYRLMEISVLPALMETSSDADGWYMLPDYSGTLIKLSGRKPCRFRDRIFMSQKEWEKFAQLNCFAVISGGQAVLGIVNDGMFFAWNDTEYAQDGKNRSYATFGIRHRPGEALPVEDKSVSYQFFPEAKDYVPLAFAYRQYLMEYFHTIPLRDRIKVNPEVEHVTHSMFIKLFLGQKMPFRPDGSGDYVNCCTFAEAEEIIDELYKAGIRKALICVVGWNNEGHDGTYPTRFPINEFAGGEAGLRHLIEKALSMGYRISPHDNVTDIYQPAPGFDYEYVSRDEDGLPQSAGLWAGGTSFKACPAVYLDRWGGDFKRIYDLGFRGTYYLDAQPTGAFCCTDPAHPLDERGFAKALARILEYPRQMFGAISCEQSQAYSLPHTDMCAHMQGENSFKNMKPRLDPDFVSAVDRVIPFLNIAAHGLVTFQVGGLKDALRLCGRTSMELSYHAKANGSDYRTTIPALMDTYKVHFEIAPEIQEAFVTSYTETEDGVIVKYDSGHTVEVKGSAVKLSKDNKILFEKDLA